MRAGASGAQVYSFDVFETCIARTFLRPEHLFVSLGRSVLATSGLSPVTSTLEQDFARARREAAEAARRGAFDRDITLGDIYDAFEVQLAPWGLRGIDVVAEEIALELASVRPIRPVAQRIEALRNAGHRIVFVSDMYLPGDVIRQMLLDQKIAEPEETVYVSADHGVTKASGALFDLVLACERISADDLAHTGDSFSADLVAARRRGVTTTLFGGSAPSRFEECLATTPVASPEVSSTIAAIARTTRLGIDTGSRLAPGAASIAAGVVAPLLTGFVDWVLRRAGEDGRRTLYFVARDGQILHRVAEVLAPSHPGIELRYLYGSRQAWSLAAVGDVSAEALSFATLSGQSTAPRHILARLDLRPEPFAPLLQHAGFRPAGWDQQLDEANRLRFRELLGEPQILQAAATRVAAARRATTAYLEQEGLTAPGDWALVDVGWTLRTQAALRTILAAAGRHDVHAYYLGISELRFPQESAGSAEGYFLEDEERLGDQPSPLFENKGMIDQIFTMADHGTTVGYRQEGPSWVPVLGPAPPDGPRAAFAELVRHATTTFALELVRRPELLHGDTLRLAGRRVTSLLLARPSSADVDALRWATISDDPNELRAVALVKRIGPITAARVLGRLWSVRRGRRGAQEGTVPALRKDLGWGFSWVEGSLAISGVPGRILAAALRGVRRAHARRLVLVRRLVDTPIVGPALTRSWPILRARS